MDVIFESDHELDDVTKTILLEYCENKKMYPEATIKKIKVEKSRVTIEFVQDKPKFERIRRITGYITGDLTTWNKAKLSEEKDRVKHI